MSDHAADRTNPQEFEVNIGEVTKHTNIISRILRIVKSTILGSGLATGLPDGLKMSSYPNFRCGSLSPLSFSVDWLLVFSFSTEKSSSTTNFRFLAWSEFKVSCIKRGSVKIGFRHS